MTENSELIGNTLEPVVNCGESGDFGKFGESDESGDYCTLCFWKMMPFFFVFIIVIVCVFTLPFSNDE